MSDTTQRLGTIKQWLQREDDELLYTPQAFGRAEQGDAAPALTQVQRELRRRRLLRVRGDMWRHPILPPTMSMGVVDAPLRDDICAIRTCDTPHGARLCTCGQYWLEWETL